MKKVLVRLVLAVIVIVIVVAVVGYLWLDSIAKAAVEHGGTYAMGVDTTVAKVSLHPFGGQMQMHGLKVANPEGFNGPHLMETGTFDVELVPGSLLGDTVVIKKFELDGLDLYIDQQMPKSNISVIMDNLKKLGGDEPEEKEVSEGTKFKVDVITIRNVVAHVKVLVGPEVTIKIPEIPLKNVTGDNAVGVALPVLVARILPAVMAAVLEADNGLLPPDLAKILQGDVSAVTAELGGQAQKLVKGVQDDIGKALKGVLPVDANAVGKQIDKAVGDTVGKILGGGATDANTDANAVGKQIDKAVGDAVGKILGGGVTDANTDANKPKVPGGGLLDGILGGKKN